MSFPTVAERAQCVAIKENPCDGTKHKQIKETSSPIDNMCSANTTQNM